MANLPEPPATYRAFIQRFPELGEAWHQIAQAGNTGPLDPETIRLVKLALAIGALREGAVHAGVRKAIAAGVSRGEIEQVLALAAGTLGMPAVVAAFSWVEDELKKQDSRPSS